MTPQAPVTRRSLLRGGLALGATGSDVRRMVLADGLRLVGVGLLAGMPIAWWAKGYAASVLAALRAPAASFTRRSPAGRSPERSPRGHSFFFVRDFDGNLIELMDLGYMYYVLGWLGPLGGWLFRRGMYRRYY